MAVRGTTVSAKAYTTDETDILEVQCPHTSKRGVFFTVYPSTVGTARVYYKDPGGTYRLFRTEAASADDLLTIAIAYPLSEMKLTYEGTSSGGTVNAEGRGH